MKKIPQTLAIACSVFFAFAAKVFGQTPLPSGVAGGDVFGTIEAPQGVAQYNAAPGAEGGIGLIVFLSNMIRIGTIVAGVWVMINFILAGWTYITAAGDAKANTDAAQKMTYSVVGIAVIVGAYTLTAVVSLVLFGDAGYILSPTFQGPGGAVAP